MTFPHSWLESGEIPNNLYTLLGRAPLDPDLAGLQAELMARHRALLRYQNSSDPRLMQRVQRLLSELGKGSVVLQDVERFALYRSEYIRGLAVEFARVSEPGQPSDMEAARTWLRSVGVHVSALDETARELVALLPLARAAGENEHPTGGSSRPREERRAATRVFGNSLSSDKGALKNDKCQRDEDNPVPLSDLVPDLVPVAPEAWDAPEPSLPLKRKTTGAPKIHLWTRWIAIAGVVTLVIAVALALAFRTLDGEVLIEVPEGLITPDIKIDGRLLPPEWLHKPIRVRAGEHTISVELDGYEVLREKFTLRRGERKALRVGLDGGPIGTYKDKSQSSSGVSVSPSRKDSPTTAAPNLRRESSSTPVRRSARGASVAHQPITARQTNSLGMELVLIEPGDFLMGDDQGEVGESPARQIRLTRSFYIGRTEVTRENYASGRNLPPPPAANAHLPMTKVSWRDAIGFCNVLSGLEGLSPYYDEQGNILGGNGYRLPLEAEWEYACRAGTQTRWYCGDEPGLLRAFAWYDTNAGGKPQEVGLKFANNWGLLDMHGNVWEWCWDRYGVYSLTNEIPLVDPRGPDHGGPRVLRGGSYDDGVDFIRVTSRSRGWPSDTYDYAGFRVARSP